MKKIYLNELEEKANELINYSKNDITAKIEELRELTKKFTWAGKSSEKYLGFYDEKINKLLEYNNGITKINEFLLIVSENYNSANQTIENAYIELIEELKKMGMI